LGWALSQSKLARFVPKTQNVDLRKVGEGLPEMCGGSESGWYSRLIDVFITQL
jgi:hypothetical protein